MDGADGLGFDPPIIKGGESSQDILSDPLAISRSELVPKYALVRDRTLSSLESPGNPAKMALLARRTSGGDPLSSWRAVGGNPDLPPSKGSNPCDKILLDRGRWIWRGYGILRSRLSPCSGRRKFFLTRLLQSPRSVASLASLSRLIIGGGRSTVG